MQQKYWKLFLGNGACKENNIAKNIYCDVCKGNGMLNTLIGIYHWITAVWSANWTKLAEIEFSQMIAKSLILTDL